MKTAFEIVGLFIISLTMMAIPILCALSFACNWLVGLKFIFGIACFIEWIGLMSLIMNVADKQD